MVSEPPLGASPAGRKEWRREGALKVAGLFLLVDRIFAVSEGERPWVGCCWDWVSPGTESMVGRAEVGTFWGEARPEGAELTEGGGGGMAGPDGRPRGRMGWSWCVDDLEPARRGRAPAAACAGAVSLPAAFCSSSAVVGVKYDWNFFMLVTIGPGRLG